MTISELYHIFLKHPKVSTDTRADLDSAIFFALKGNAFNGNAFARQALEKGAAYCVIDEPEFQLDQRTILVDNALETLQQLAAFHREQFNIPVLAITGTNGKTTTKELINAVLSTTYKTVCTQGNLNNHIGVPLTLLSISKNTEFTIVEMGANHPKEIDLLCNIAKPNFGLITNIGKAHLEGFGNFEGVVNAKNELYSYIKQHHGTIFVNGDDSLLMNLADNIQKVTYGKNPANDFSGDIVEMAPFLSVAFLLERELYQVNSQLIGSYNLYNILAAACIGNYFHVPADKIAASLKAYKPDNMRSQIEKRGSNTIILDTYNANPTSMAAAIDNFVTLKAPHKMALLGDMLELGAWSDEEHKKIVEKLKENDIKNVLLVGKAFKKASEDSGFLCFADVDELSHYLKENPINEALILIKGSRGIKLEKALEQF